MAKYIYDLNVLKKSTMFHMSLGSKELFHSNFLHWISIANWDAFLKIMHGLAGLKGNKQFWWEKHECSVEGCKGKYCPDNNNVKVFREHRNFDLSIYILYSEKEAKGDNNYIVADEDNTTEYTQDSEGKKKIQKWLPVLVLENKMKSLPYVEQLESYTQKAFEEWANIIKEEALENLNKELTVSEENKYSLTFILLSLEQTTLAQYEFKNEREGKRPRFKLTLQSEWQRKTYEELLTQLKKVDSSTFAKIDKLILNDYCKFVKALCHLAQTWTINPLEAYRSQIFPWNIDAHAKIEEINKYKELRIHDIHEKLLYEQLLFLLESKFKENGIQFSRYDTKANKKLFEEKKVRIFTKSNYAHGVGIFEVHYFLSENKSGKVDYNTLIIQVQGDRYCHMLLCDDIVEEEKSVKIESLNQNESLKSKIDKLKNYIQIDGSTPQFPNWNKTLVGDGADVFVTEPGWGKYGKNLIYQYVTIPDNVTINDVIAAIVDDIIAIEGWFDNL